MHRLEEASSGEVRQTTSIIAIGLVGSERLERLVGPAGSRRRPLGDQAGSTRETGSAPFAPSRIQSDGNSALWPVRRRSPLLSTPPCSREPPCLRGQERKHASPPSRYRGQRNSPCRISSSKSPPMLSAFVEELPPITRC